MEGVKGPFIADIAGAGQGDDGETVHITIVGKERAHQSLLFSYMLLPKLITAILAGGRMAGETRVKKFGTKAAADAMLGLEALKVRTVDLGLAENKLDVDVILRLNLQAGVSFDMALSPNQAGQLAEGLRQTASKVGTMKDRKPN